MSNLRLGLGLILAMTAASLALSGPAWAGTFPGSNGPIAYSSSDGADEEIYTTIGDGSPRKKVTDNSSINDRYPSVSRSGMIAYECGGNICSISQAGTGFKQLTNSSLPNFNTRPSWSPDGKKIAFVSVSNSNYDIYTMDSNGSNLKRLTRDAGRDDHPAWSPNGNTIAYDRSGDGFSEVYSIPAAGGTPSYVTKDAVPTQNSNPTWSPDGKVIAFAGSFQGEREIWEVGPTGGAAFQVTASDAIGEENPTYSPDGKRLAYESADSGDLEIYTISKSGGIPTNVTNATTSDFAPDWGTVPIVFRFFTPVFRQKLVILKAKVTNGQGNLEENDIAFYMDGRRVEASKFAYDSSTDRLSYESRLERGRHRAKIVALDQTTGLYATTTLRFKVRR